MRLLAPLLRRAGAFLWEIERAEELRLHYAPDVGTLTEIVGSDVGIGALTLLLPIEGRSGQRAFCYSIARRMIRSARVRGWTRNALALIRLRLIYPASVSDSDLETAARAAKELARRDAQNLDTRRSRSILSLSYAEGVVPDPRGASSCGRTVVLLGGLTSSTKDHIAAEDGLQIATLSDLLTAEATGKAPASG